MRDFEKECPIGHHNISIAAQSAAVASKLGGIWRDQRALEAVHLWGENIFAAGRPFEAEFSLCIISCIRGRFFAELRQTANPLYASHLQPAHIRLIYKINEGMYHSELNERLAKS